MRGKMVASGLLLVLLIGAAVGWMERASMQSWYYLRGLSRASEEERGRWIERVAGLGESVVEGLLDQLDGDDRSCQNAVAALDYLARTWGESDPRTVDLISREGRLFARMSPASQMLVLQGMAGWFHGDPSATGLLPACARLLADAAASKDETQRAALELAAVLVRQPQGGEAMQPARALARAGLQSESANNRLRAVQLSLHPGMDMLESVVGLLRDPSVEVRRAAILAVGSADQVVRDEGLLPSLHDPDAEVRRLTREALLGRGLRPVHLELGRLLTHPDPRMRVRVLDHLGEATDLDPGLWLRRLSHDKEMSVRVAAVRVMSEMTVIDLTDRLDQMARSDPSPTVAWIARYYLSCKRNPEPSE